MEPRGLVGATAFLNPRRGGASGPLPMVCLGGDPGRGGPAGAADHPTGAGAHSKNGRGRVPDASHTMDFEETDASRTRPQPFLPVYYFS
eukprot:gene19076-biopygen14532